jgi:hypothetical protein
LSDHHEDNAAMAYIETDLKLRELCQQASKEHDHEKLIDLIRQINDLLDMTCSITSTVNPVPRTLTSSRPRPHSQHSSAVTETGG